MPTCPFSILERIEFPATYQAASLRSVGRFFQYPRTDRIPCNCLWKCSPITRNYLSVSSNGSNSLQHSYVCCSLRLGTLSVSSNGSNSLQHRNVPYVKPDLNPFSILERIEFPAPPHRFPCILRHVSFQYPRTDRIPCNCRSNLLPRT